MQDTYREGRATLMVLMLFLVMPFITDFPIVNVGQSGLLATVVLLVITDRLVWHKRLEVLQKQIDTKDALIEDLTKQNSMMLGSAIPTVNAVLNALNDAAGGGS